MPGACTFLVVQERTLVQRLKMTLSEQISGSFAVRIVRGGRLSTKKMALMDDLSVTGIS
jgi:hypothetical protein